MFHWKNVLFYWVYYTISLFYTPQLYPSTIPLYFTPLLSPSSIPLFYTPLILTQLFSLGQQRTLKDSVLHNIWYSSLTPLEDVELHSWKWVVINELWNKTFSNETIDWAELTLSLSRACLKYIDNLLFHWAKHFKTLFVKILLRLRP